MLALYRELTVIYDYPDGEKHTNIFAAFAMFNYLNLDIKQNMYSNIRTFLPENHKNRINYNCKSHMNTCEFMVTAKKGKFCILLSDI